MMTLAEQQQFVRDHAEAAYTEALAFMVEHKQDIIDGMPVRLVVGFGDYGDGSFRENRENLTRGAYEEAVDLCNYRAFDIYRREQPVVSDEDPVVEHALAGGPDD